VSAPVSRQQLREAYAAAADRARTDAQAGVVLDAAAIRAAAAEAYAHPDLATTWVDGYEVTTGALRQAR
jgi:hypothetical protein